MTTVTLADISKAIAHIDYAMFSTRASNGYLASRPMSNNGDVDYDGDSYFFAFEQSHTIDDIKRDPKVGLSFVGTVLLGKPTFIAIEAHAELIHDKATFQQHWNEDIDDWAKDGIETPGLVLIKAHAVRIHYWHGNDQQEIVP